MDITKRLRTIYESAIKARKKNVILTMDELALVLAYIAELQEKLLEKNKNTNEQVITIISDAGFFSGTSGKK